MIASKCILCWGPTPTFHETVMPVSQKAKSSIDLVFYLTDRKTKLTFQARTHCNNFSNRGEKITTFSRMVSVLRLTCKSALPNFGEECQTTYEFHKLRPKIPKCSGQMAVAPGCHVVATQVVRLPWLKMSLLKSMASNLKWPSLMEKSVR